MCRIVISLLLIALTVAFCELAAAPAPPEISTTIYDSNPSHIWNRLYAALLIRKNRHGTQFGADSLDPLLWPETEHLLAEPSHQLTLQVLDEFLQTHAENLIHDPINRALFSVICGPCSPRLSSNSLQGIGPSTPKKEGITDPAGGSALAPRGHARSS